MDYVGKSDCQMRMIYRIISRNLSYGVYDGKGGFIGIREKFDDRYLFTEYHWDDGAPFGTVRVIGAIELLPDWIPLREYFDSICGNCGRIVQAVPSAVTCHLCHLKRSL